MKLISIIMMASLTFGLAHASDSIKIQQSAEKQTYGLAFLASPSSAKAGSVLADITQSGKNWEQCVESCGNQFLSCIATAQGVGAWWECELAFEACEADCF